jgi:hypothetical protein
MAHRADRLPIIPAGVRLRQLYGVLARAEAPLRQALAEPAQEVRR